MLGRRTALLATALAAPAFAQERYPSRAVTLIVPGAPGGGGDFTARLLADGLAGPLGQAVTVENRTGGSGNVAASHVARAAPDGHTLLIAYSGTHVANPALFRELAWHPIRSFAPVALLLTAPHVLVIRPDLPARNMAELSEYIRRNPGRVSYASSGVASIQHLGGAMLAQALGTEMVHVPYRGAGPAMSDIMAGRVDMIITTPPAVMGQIQSGAVRAIVQTGRTRHPMLPDLPTTAEAGLPGFELEAWFGLYAPAGTPREAVLRLARDVEGVTRSAEFRRKAEEAGTYVTFLPPDELAAFTTAELTRWSGIIQALGIRLD